MATTKEEDEEMAAIRTTKKELRKVMKERLKHVEAQNVITQSSLIAKTLFEQTEYRSARRISIYLSMPTAEVHTPEIVRHALRNGKRVFVPCFYAVPSHIPSSSLSQASAKPKPRKEMIMDMLELHDLNDYETLQPDAWGIPTPSEESIKERANAFGGVGRSIDQDGAGEGEGLDVIVTPGLAFDRERGRLGRGKGFYDRFFERCEKDGVRAPFKIGLSLIDQLLPDGERIPMDETDVQLDAVIAGDGSVYR